MKYNGLCVSPFSPRTLFKSPAALTHRPIFTIYASNDVVPPKEVPFGGYICIALPFGVVSPQNNLNHAPLWDFQAKAKNSKYRRHFTTRRPIIAKLCKDMYNYDLFMEINQKFEKLKIQDGGGRHIGFWKMLIISERSNRFR